MIKKKSLAFTLAEILIALAIIGVVAALTVPKAMTGANTKANIVKLKRAYSGIQEALRMASAKAGYDMSDITALDNSDSLYPFNAQDLLATAFDATVKSDAIYYNATSAAPFVSYDNGAVSYNLNSQGSAVVIYSHTDTTENIKDLLFVGRNGVHYIIKGKKISGDDVISGGCSVSHPCILYIDINGNFKKPNRIVTCTSGDDALGDIPLDDTGVYTDPVPDIVESTEEICVVDDNGVTDIYPFLIYDAEVRPATRSVVAVLEK